MATSPGSSGGEAEAGVSGFDICFWLILLGGGLFIEAYLIWSGWSPFKLGGSPPRPGFEGWLLAGCFVPALVSVVFAGYRHESRAGAQKGLFRPVYGMPTWDPTSSWASNLTTAGGILGVILAQSVLSKETTHYFTTYQYTLLAILFSGLIILAPFFYNCFTTTVPDPTTLEPTRCGYGITFLVACLLTSWAVCGQLVVSWFIVAEFETISPASLPTINAFHMALGVAVPLVAFYVINTVPGVMAAQHLPKTKAIHLLPERVIVAPPAKKWALL